MKINQFLCYCRNMVYLSICVRSLFRLFFFIYLPKTIKTMCIKCAIYLYSYIQTLILLDFIINGQVHACMSKLKIYYPKIKNMCKKLQKKKTQIQVLDKVFTQKKNIQP